jgi:[ribosomal protein S18]-alanine N-acetyltransferase
MEAGRLLISGYQAEDIHRLHQIDAICFPPDIAFSRAELLSYTRHKFSITRIARLDGAIAGFAIGRIEKSHSAHVLTLDVLPDARRRKIGTALMSALHEEFRRQGSRISVLEVDVHNAAARRFYEKLHYNYSRMLPGYYRGRTDACRMVLALTPSPNP